MSRSRAGGARRQAESLAKEAAEMCFVCEAMVVGNIGDPPIAMAWVTQDEKAPVQTALTDIMPNAAGPLELPIELAAGDTEIFGERGRCQFLPMQILLDMSADATDEVMPAQHRRKRITLRSEIQTSGHQRQDRRGDGRGLDPSQPRGGGGQRHKMPGQECTHRCFP